MMLLIARLTTMFILVSSLLLAISARTKTLTGNFYPEKQVYLVGEPVFIDFEIANTGDHSIWIDQHLGAPRMVPDTIEVVGARYPSNSTSGCFGEVWATTGAVGLFELKSGEHRTERIFLTPSFKLDHPGIYKVHARRVVPVSAVPIEGMAIVKFLESPTTKGFSSDFQISLVAGSVAELQAAYQPYVKDTEQPESEAEAQAVSAITMMAPPFLEDVILKLADGPNRVRESISGLARLNTPRATQKLAQLAEHAEAAAVKQTAISALAGTRDRSYLPLLIRIAHNSTGWSRDAAIAGAGLLGEDAVPFLVSMLRDPDADARDSAAGGLGNTASRSAIAPLVEALQDPDVHVFFAATRSLAQLTHRSITTNPWLETPSADTYRRWLSWWSKNALSAPIYNAHNCAQLKALD